MVGPHRIHYTCISIQQCAQFTNPPITLYMPMTSIDSCLYPWQHKRESSVRRVPQVLKLIVSYESTALASIAR